MKEIPEVRAILGCGWSGCDRAQLREDVSKVCRDYAVRVLEERRDFNRDLEASASRDNSYEARVIQSVAHERASELGWLADRIKRGEE